jgi:hypothetical protein
VLSRCAVLSVSRAVVLMQQLLQTQCLPAATGASCSYLKLTLLATFLLISVSNSLLCAQATTFLQIEAAAQTESGEDVAHLLALLPGLRCVGIGGKWADSPESWAAIVPTLSACQELRFSGEGCMADPVRWQEVMDSVQHVRRH